MTQRTLITGNGAAAWGARLAGAEYMPVFPITPQTEIIETLGDWIGKGEMGGRMVTLESEHSMITAAGAGAATGVRVFTATSSQGLLYGMEMLYTVAGWRVPLVLVNVSRGLSAPITLEPDHNDILAARDSGCLQIHAATCQEVVDAILIAYRVAEDARVRLPAIVNLDGFYLSFTREPVWLPDASKVAQFLPDMDPDEFAFRADKPVSAAVAVLGGGPYSYFRYQTHLAALGAVEVFEEACVEYDRVFGRSYAPVMAHRLDDAEIVFVMMGSFATKAMDAVDRLRAQGVKAGLARPLLLRPWPQDAIRKALTGRKAVVVVDQNLSMGFGGVLRGEVASALYGQADAPGALLGYVGGLGGRDITFAEFAEMAREAETAAAGGEAPPTRLLYTQAELREVRNLQTLAHAQGLTPGGEGRS
ncbi:MAG: pyruvate synthase [Alphaproteobacteria bacterium]|nr:pyruvate synthase [Alphaproteobacteria bacterium]